VDLGARRPALPRRALIGAGLVGALVVLALLAPWLADPVRLDLDHGVSALGAPLPPSWAAPLGTDDLGRDVAARIAAGAGTSLVIAGLATALALAIGVPLGVWAGYRGGWVDALLMRGVDLVLAFPLLLLAILLAALLRETRLAGTIAPVCLVLGAVGWTTIARVVRAHAAVLARAEYVTAARALGASRLRIVVRHLTPNLAGAIAALAALSVSQNLLGEAALSYLGLGPPPTTPTWGRMIAEGHGYYRTAPWLVVAPGVAIVIAVLGFTLLGEGLRGGPAGEAR
jgi:ABC-type dipeptide/oligopeptide/nickel transport system permease subunit